ncbi:DUF559 domain-containing protein [Gracilimonas sp.]
MNEPHQKSITEIARELRKNPTPPEKRLWKYIRNRQLGDFLNLYLSK